ncbi:signal peptidase I [Balneolales bacterium ANBcel1]|nr:signal peptidase I [Balneolales bacterium ANBcel1]
MAGKKEEKNTRRKESRRALDRKSREEAKNAKSWAREWLDAILFAAVAALIIRALFLEAFRIPTPSMESTLLTGDFLLVSKLHYGARSPMTVGIPFTGIYIRGLELPWFRMPGFMSVRRGDILVFNYPIEDEAISQKTNYIKRTVGIAGDTLSIRDKVIHINSQPEEHLDTFEQHYDVQVRQRLRLSPSKVRNAGGQVLQSSGDRYRINMTADVADAMAEWPEIASVQPLVLPESFNDYARQPFTFASGFSGNYHNLPDIIIPFEGQQVILTDENWHLYEDIVTRYERNTVSRDQNLFIINGDTTDQYTIRQDYYFMVGDSRDNSEDSRFWGFVPDDHIVGRAWVIYFSWDRERFLPRVRRMLNRIN